MRKYCSMAEQPSGASQSDIQPNESVTRALEPVTILTRPERAPAEMLEEVLVRDGRLVVETAMGEIGVELYALPALEDVVQIPFFKHGSGQKTKRPRAVQIEIEPTVKHDETTVVDSAPLMGLYPHAVLQDGTRYGIIVTAPTGLVDQDWSERKERPVPGFNPRSNAITVEAGIEYNLRELYRQRKGLDVAIRVDGKYPLAQQEQGSLSDGIVRREKLIGDFKPARRGKGMSYTGAAKRATQTLGRGMVSPGLGQEGEVNAITEDLIFTLSGNEVEKGVVEVIVFEVTREEVTELITPDLYGGLESSSRADLTRQFPTRKSLRQGFFPGQTNFGEPKRTRVKKKGIKDQKPIAAFRMVLVGEDTDEGLIMKAAKPQA
jgi:hypothetical protein